MTQCLFLKFSELQVRVDGVDAMPRRHDAVDGAVRESTRLASELTSVPHRRGLGAREIAEGGDHPRGLSAARSKRVAGLPIQMVGLLELAVRIAASSHRDQIRKKDH